MGGVEKCLLPLAGRPMISHVIDRFAPQVTGLALSANGDLCRFRTLGLPVVADDMAAGPLAGVLAGMRWARAACASDFVATVPADTPLIPYDLVVRLQSTIGEADVAVAASADRIHPVIALWRARLSEDLAAWLSDPGNRKAESWIRSRKLAVVAFPEESPDAFFNVNTPDNFEAAVQLVADAQASDGVRAAQRCSQRTVAF